MIGQLTVLLRVKELKEQQAFRAVHAKRQELAQADRSVAAARATVEASAATLEARADAAYRAIIGRDIELGEVDDAKGKVLKIQQDHARLVDECDRAIHVRARVEGELTAAVQRHHEATKVKDKYIILQDELGREAAQIVALREETEIEDLFSTRRQKLA
jgi:hypothetical protein